LKLMYAGAVGILLFLLGFTTGKIYPILNFIWLIYTLALLGLVLYWAKHLKAYTDNLLLDTPDQVMAEKTFPINLTEIAGVGRNLARVYRKLQLAEFSVMNQKARQAGENFNLMLSNTTDPLTGVPNRRELDRHLDRVMGKMNPLSVIMVDIDHFKKVNDTYGHEAGDRVLQSFASTVKASIRPSDFLGRYGGEEFMVICCAGLEEAAEIAERVREAVFSTPVGVSEDRNISITASFGVAQQMPGEDAASVVKRADGALYRAKQEGRNRVVGGGEMRCAG